MVLNLGPLCVRNLTPVDSSVAYGPTVADNLSIVVL
jgi:hypothetical protein